MTPLTFVTSNKGKANEAQTILGVPIEIIDLELLEMQSLDMEEIARVKAQDAFAKLHKPLLVDDVGLRVEAWNGFPGPFIKYVLKTGGYQLLQKMMETTEDRTVVAVAALAYHDGEKIHTFIGEKKGTLAKQARGENGWGWDFVFIPEGETHTYAQLGEEIKNNISHRYEALKKFKHYLTNL